MKGIWDKMKKTKLLLNLIFLLLSLYGYGNASNIMTYLYEGIIQSSTLPDVLAGDNFNGILNVDLDADIYSENTDGNISFQTNNFNFSSNPVSFQYSNDNNGYDYFDIYSYDLSGTQNQYFYLLRFSGPDTTYSDPQNMNLYDFFNLINNNVFSSSYSELHEFSSGTQLYGTINNFSQAENNIIPEPSSILLIAFGIISLLRKKYFNSIISPVR